MTLTVLTAYFFRYLFSGTLSAHHSFCFWLSRSYQLDPHSPYRILLQTFSLLDGRIGTLTRFHSLIPQYSTGFSLLYVRVGMPTPLLWRRLIPFSTDPLGIYLTRHVGMSTTTHFHRSHYPSHFSQKKIHKPIGALRHVVRHRLVGKPTIIPTRS